MKALVSNTSFCSCFKRTNVLEPVEPNSKFDPFFRKVVFVLRSTLEAIEIVYVVLFIFFMFRSKLILKGVRSNLHVDKSSLDSFDNAFIYDRKVVNLKNAVRYANLAYITTLMQCE